MPEGEGRTAIIRAVDSIHDIGADNWDACAGADNPFLSFDFLSAMEDSGSVASDTGWLPHHLVLEAEGQAEAVVPLYLKGHSYGEYVFDWGWADAYERAGGRYYPKLISTVPYTPVTGPRLLIRPEVERKPVAAALAEAMKETTERQGFSSLHAIFADEDDWSLLGDKGFLRRTALQYHWRNDGYETFDDFLGALSSRKRKSIRKERREAASHGIDILMLTGDAIEERHWDAFFRFYRDTTDRKWGSAYLTRSFFSMLGERMADRVLLVMAEMNGTLVGGALNLIGKDALYGRNWGCLADFRFLHFECCYYRAIDFAIERGLSTVEAGAQGQHKIQRGYLPTHTYSAHYIPDAGFRNAVEDFLIRERRQIEREKEYLAETSPFRKTDGS